MDKAQRDFLEALEGLQRTAQLRGDTLTAEDIQREIQFVRASKAVSPQLIDRAKKLTRGVEVDLNTPLPPED